ncbi:MAG: NUDIX domain-containing protein [Cyanobacteria bacterium P01_D01_bin.44]
MTYTYHYPRPAMTVDCVVFGVDFGSDVGLPGQLTLNVLLIQRSLPPFQGGWALPGGFVKLDESLEAAARRELYEEAGLENVFLEQLYTFGEPDRDPRDRTVSVAYYALINTHSYRLQAATDASDASWFSIEGLPPLAFDHGRMVSVAIARLRAKIRYEPIGFELLPTKFTLTQLQQLYETILNRPLDKRNFRKKLLKMGILIALSEKETNVAHRAAQLYQFDAQQYEALKQSGFNFEI